MIVGVPDANELRETAIGWLNLAWEVAINEVREFQEVDEYFDALAREYEEEPRQEEINKFWDTSRYNLNNAISLLQQSLEIALKARIAEVSPYLLIAGDPQSWPTVNSSNNEADFADF
jgi:DNA-binding ferritin-like protein (Dps family)